MTYYIQPKSLVIEIEANTPEEAIEKFANGMSLDINEYFEAKDSIECKNSLEKFSYEEAQSRLEDMYEEFTEDDVEKAGIRLYNYLLNCENAMNYDMFDQIIEEVMEGK